MELQLKLKPELNQQYQSSNLENCHFLRKDKIFPAQRVVAKNYENMKTLEGHLNIKKSLLTSFLIFFNPFNLINMSKKSKTEFAKYF